MYGQAVKAIGSNENYGPMSFRGSNPLASSNLKVGWFESPSRKNNNETLPPRGVVRVTLNMFQNNVLKGQVLSLVKVCEESEVTTNIQLYEIKQMSFTIKLYLKNVTALANTFN